MGTCKKLPLPQYFLNRLFATKAAGTFIMSPLAL
jgi:hypothetical protein